MKRLLWSMFMLFGVLVLGIVSCAPAEEDDISGSKDLGDVSFETISGFSSTNISKSRNIKIMLPGTYSSGTASYPVLYMHDGQNIFAPGGTYGSWDVEVAYQELADAYKINEIIIVGMDNTDDRMSEYTDTVDSTYGGGNGDNYIKMIKYELIPHINSKYRTKTGPENTAIMGSSLGGLISFYAGWNYSDTFGMAGCVSSSFWWDDQNLLKSIVNYSGAKKNVKFWVDAGNAEGDDTTDTGSPNWVANNGATDMAEDAYYMANRLVELGWVNESDVMLDIDYNGGHNEAAWRGRVHKPLLFFFKKSAPTLSGFSATFSSSSIDKKSLIPNVLIFVKATYDNGLEAEVPFTNLTLTSPQSDLYYVSNTMIYLHTNLITQNTQIVFTVDYGSKQTTATLSVVGDYVDVHLEITTPDNSGNTIYMVGNIPELGSWDPPSGFVLYEESSGGGQKVYTNILNVARDAIMSFKYCAGNSWSYEELKSDSSAADDRSFTASSPTNDTSYSGTVALWKAVP